MASKQESPEKFFKRLTRIFKSGVTVKRKIRAQDTHVAVADKTKSSGTLLFQKSFSPTYATITSNAYNIGERLVRYQDFQQMEQCLSAKTIIPGPDSEKRTIKDLEEKCKIDPNYKFIVYSYDHSKKQIVPAWGKQARQTCVDHAWKITFDSGKSLICSELHRLMLRDGTYVKTKDLIPGMSMMPFYKKDLYHNSSETDGYRWIYTMADNAYKGWKKEHQLIAEWVTQRELTSEEVVHHVNFVKHDNNPENLCIMNDIEHRSYHANLIMKNFWNNSEWVEKFKREHSKFMTENNPALRKDITFGRILETAERVGFHKKELECALDTGYGVICHRLRQHGFKNFSAFAKAYQPKWSTFGRNVKGIKNPRYDHSLTFEQICDAFEPNMSVKKLSEKLSSTHMKIYHRIKVNGYKNWADFKENYKNHKIVSVEYFGEIPLYDITVDGYKNFATDSVISHNTAEIAAALDLWADETTSPSETGRSLHIFSDNEKIKQILEDLFYNTLNIEFNARGWVRNLCKYGDMFLLHDVHPDKGVVNVYPIPVNEIEREEGYDRDDPMAVRFRWVALGNRVLQNWEVSHFRLLGNDSFLPYGCSVIEAARRVWRQLILIEDAMLVYRVVRAPERRVFYIDVGNLPANDVPAYIELAKQQLRMNQVVDSTSSRVDMRYNPLPIHYDTPIPLLDGTTLTIENLSKKMNDNPNWIPWVYSIQDKTSRIVPGRVTWCGKNYTAKKLVKVWLDNDSYVSTAPEHPFILRDGSSKRADELLVGDSLMPFYRKLSTKEDGFNVIGYDTVYDAKLNKYVLTHRIVANESLNQERENVRKNIDWDKNNNLVAHHADFNKLNNSPLNLKWMGNTDHFKLHAALGGESITKYNKSDLKRKRTSINNIERNSVGAMSWYNGSDLHKSHNENRKIGQLKAWGDDNKKTQRKLNMQWKIPNEMIEKIREIIRNDPKASRVKIHEEISGNKQLMDSLLSSQTSARDVSKFSYQAWMGEFQRRGQGGRLTEIRQSVLGYKNHKVSKIEFLEVEGEDVYCMTVVGSNGEDDRHNFMVLGMNEDGSWSDSGVSLRNSVDEDYFIPIRGGDTGTKIDTLQAGQNTGTVEDVAYIQKKLFAALKIPKAYLGYEEGLSCLPGNTKIPTFKQTGIDSLTIEQLSSECEQDPKSFAGKHHVYAWNHEQRKIVPAKIVKAWKTKQVQKLHEIEFNDGSKIKCTENHPFLLRNGSTYRRADELKIGDSIMPHITRLSEKQSDYLDGYHMFFDPETNQWKYSHRVAGEYKYGQLNSSNVIHHVDFDKLNNDPSNLLWMKSGKIHQYLHATLNRIHKIYRGKGNPRYNHDATFQTLIDNARNCQTKSELIAKTGIKSRVFHRLLSENDVNWQDFVKKYMPLNVCSHRSGGYGQITFDDVKRVSLLFGKNVNRTLVANELGTSSAVVNGRVFDAGFASWEHFKREVLWKLDKQSVLVSLARHQTFENAYEKDYRDKCGKTAFLLFVRKTWGGIKQLKTEASGLEINNHTVASIKIIDCDEPVYDIEVENHHNFAVSLEGGIDNFKGHNVYENGIYVHNSKSTLAQMDIRFSRSISVIQKTIISELNKLAIIHLFALGYENEDLANFTLHLSNPSTVAEQQKLELWRTRFEIGGSLPEGMGTKRFVYKTIWGLTDEQIDNINTDRVKETLTDATIAAMAEGEAPGGPGGGGGGGGAPAPGGDLDIGAGGEDEDIFADDGGDDAGSEDADDEIPDEENASSEPLEDEDPEAELLTSSDDLGDGQTFKIPSMKDSPVKIAKQLKRALYNNSRHRTHGPSKTHMPDFLGMVNSKRREDTMNDPYDTNDMKALITNPFGESRLHERTSLTNDIMSALRNMNSALRSERSKRQETVGMLTESRNDDNDDELTLLDDVFEDDEQGYNNTDES